MIRDSSLQVAGLLNLKEGGPERLPRTARRDAPRRAAAGRFPSPEERNRRSVYIFVRRNTRYPMLEAFDMPDTHESCSRRDVTTTAPQALTMLNDKVALEWAQRFAGRALAAPDPLDRAFRLAYSRPPGCVGKGHCRHLPAQAEVRHCRARRAWRELALPTLRAGRASVEPDYAAAFVDFCQMLLNSNEFVYRN